MKSNPAYETLIHLLVRLTHVPQLTPQLDSAQVSCSNPHYTVFSELFPVLSAVCRNGSPPPSPTNQCIFEHKLSWSQNPNMTNMSQLEKLTRWGRLASVPEPAAWFPPPPILAPHSHALQVVILSSVMMKTQLHALIQYAHYISYCIIRYTEYKGGVHGMWERGSTAPGHFLISFFWERMKCLLLDLDTDCLDNCRVEDNSETL